MQTVAVLLAISLTVASSLPTLYKYNDNKMLEPDLVAVSSTVIPIPVYKVGYGLNVATNGNRDKHLKKPEGPITLVTANNRKKATEVKYKIDDQQVSSVKKLSMT